MSNAESTAPDKASRSSSHPSRRDVLRAGSGITVGLFLGGMSGPASASADAPGVVNSWLTVSPDNSVTLTIGTTEMGQGSRSGLAQIIAEDLKVDITKVTLVQGGATLAYSGSAAVARGYATSTGGSGAIRNNFWALRDAATRTREMLVQAAMDKVGDFTRANYVAANATITYTPRNLTYRYGELAEAAAQKTSTATAPDVPFDALTVIGKTVPRADIPPKLNGTAIYGVDVVLPNMVFAVVRHCPTFGGALLSAPATPSGAIAAVPLKILDFKYNDPNRGNAPSVLKLSRGLDVADSVNAVAVVASNTWDAMRAATRLSLSWSLPSAASAMNDANFLADAMALATQATMPSAQPGAVTSTSANPPATLYTCEGSYAAAEFALAGATKIIDATYTLPYAAHAAMEVLSCTVDYKPGVRCTLHVSTQVQQNTLRLVALILSAHDPAFSLANTQNIQINTTYLGGALGRKLEIDFISQAVQTAIAVAQLPGGARPVKLMWTREQDFTRDQYRPMALIHARAGVKGSGANAAIAGWEYRVISPSIAAQRGSVLNADPGRGVVGDAQGSESARELPYAMDQRLTEYVTHPAQIPVGYWRSVGASINVFAVESMIDELAVGAGADPYAFRRNLLLASIAAGGADAAMAQRWLAVLDKAAALAKWGSPASGNAQGIAVGAAFNSIIAMVVELSGASTTNAATGSVANSVNVKKVSVALDSYLVVNPGSVEAQLQGGIVHGLNAVLYGGQNFVNGVAQKANFNRYKMMRLQQMPDVQVTITQPEYLSRSATIGGVGELGVPPLAPAVANAFYRATGRRVRNLPFFS
jgi:isoquinoline 1-oxidoreductase beta subunit